MLAVPSRVSRPLVGETDLQKIYSAIGGEIRLGLTNLSESKYEEKMASRRREKINEKPSTNGEKPAV